jgi:hypothetical protein
MAKVRLMGRSRRKDEGLAELAADIESIVHRAYPTGDLGMWDTLSRDYFINALNDAEMKKQVKLSRPTSLQAALEAALEYEAVAASVQTIQHSPQKRAFVREVRAKSDQRKYNHEDKPRSGNENMKQLMTDLLTELKKLEERKDNRVYQPRNQNYNSRRRRDSGCYNCGSRDHYKRDCPQVRKPSEPSPEVPSTQLN